MSSARSHFFARSEFAERADRLIASVWERGWDEKPSLDPDYLWQVGSNGYSREDEASIRCEEDVADFRLRLERLCHSLNHEAELNALGHTVAYGQLKNAIRKRHALGRVWRERPELAETPLARPIIVLGQMRSGTTRVQRLLATDPRHSGTRFCDSHDPVPSRPDWRPLKAHAALFMARRVKPWLDTLHPFGPTRTDEEIGWLAAALSPAAFEAQWRIPSFVEFSERIDHAPVYREFARILRTDAANHGSSARPRVLKCPQFSEDLPALLEQFPDARIVWCKRDRKEVLASSVSMVASQMAFQSDEHDLASLEAEWNRKLALREDRMSEALGSFAGPVAEVDFRDLNADWRSTMASTYARLGLDWGPTAEAAMAQEHARSSGGAHTAHQEQIQGLAARA